MVRSCCKSLHHKEEVWAAQNYRDVMQEIEKMIHPRTKVKGCNILLQWLFIKMREHLIGAFVSFLQKIRIFKIRGAQFDEEVWLNLCRKIGKLRLAWSPLPPHFPNFLDFCLDNWTAFRSVSNELHLKQQQIRDIPGSPSLHLSDAWSR